MLTFTLRSSVGFRTALAVISCLPLAGCQFATDDVDEDICIKSLSVAGEVHGFNSANTDYQTQSIWFNTSVEEVSMEAIRASISDADRSRMRQWGLDDQAEADMRLFYQFTKNYDARTLIAERVNATVGVEDVEGLHFEDELSKESLGVYFFELQKFNVQPGDSVNVFNLSELNSDISLTDEERGNKVRTLISDMLSNDQADVVVAYAPDRSGENVQGYFINLFAEDVYFASGGYGRFHELYESDGAEKTSLEYPVLTPVAMSTDVDGQFAQGSMSIEARCIGLFISGDGSN